MPTGQGQTIGSRVDGTSGRQYIADVTSEGALAVSGVVNAQVSGLGLEDFTLRYKQLADYQGGYYPTYLGLANPGTATGSPSWMIRKHIYSNNIFVSGLFASGNTNFDKIWDNRSGTQEVYS